MRNYCGRSSKVSEPRRRQCPDLRRQLRRCASRAIEGWLESALSGTETIGLTWGVLLAFLRVTTRRGILQRPLPVHEAVAYVDSWLQQPCVTVVEPGPNHWAILRSLTIASGTAGNLTSDAHLAAHAIEGGWTVVSTDRDFGRFSGVNVVSPVAE